MLINLTDINICIVSCVIRYIHLQMTSGKQNIYMRAKTIMKNIHESKNGLVTHLYFLFPYNACKIMYMYESIENFYRCLCVIQLIM